MWQIVARVEKRLLLFAALLRRHCALTLQESMGNIRHAIFLFFVMVFPPLASGGEANNPRLQKLYRTFIAPCCWSKNLMEHNSQVAAEMRAKLT